LRARKKNASASRELHDDVGQRLAFVAMELARLSAQSGGWKTLSTPSRTRWFGLSETYAGYLTGFARHLDDIGLAPAMQAECKQLSF
jgi:nitrate/nitrite-specific signal transduction histidine kinase